MIKRFHLSDILSDKVNVVTLNKKLNILKTSVINIYIYNLMIKQQ